MQIIDWQLQPLAKTCTQSGQQFKPGQKVFSLLFLDEEGMLQRNDYTNEEEGEIFRSQRKTLGWWSQVIKEDMSEKVTRAQSDKNAELLFLSLYENQDVTDKGGVVGEEISNEKFLLKYLLALALERRRILRAIKQRLDEEGQNYLHIKSQKNYWVPTPVVEQETLIKIQEQLKCLLN